MCFSSGLRNIYSVEHSRDYHIKHGVKKHEWWGGGSPKERDTKTSYIACRITSAQDDRTLQSPRILLIHVVYNCVGSKHKAAPPTTLGSSMRKECVEGIHTVHGRRAGTGQDHRERESSPAFPPPCIPCLPPLF